MKKLLCFASIAILISSCAHRPRPKEPTSARLPSPSREYTEDGTCHSLHLEDRNLLLSIADPLNYPGTRYRHGANLALSAEAATDCSHFVHEVYSRAGLNYQFRPTDDFVDAPEFELIRDEDAQPGDVLVIQGRHMGILDEAGKLISATRTYRRRRPSSITRFDLNNFRRLRGKRYILRYRCRPLSAGMVE